MRPSKLSLGTLMITESNVATKLVEQSEDNTRAPLCITPHIYSQTHKLLHRVPCDAFFRLSVVPRGSRSLFICNSFTSNNGKVAERRHDWTLIRTFPPPSKLILKKCVNK